MKLSLVLAGLLLGCSAYIAHAENFNLVCDVAGDLAQQQCILQVADPIIPVIQLPSVSLVSPNYGKMTVYEINNIRLAAHIHHPVPGSPNADLAFVVNRNTGYASLYLLKSPRFSSIDIFWFPDDDLIGKSVGTCRKGSPVF